MIELLNTAVTCRAVFWAYWPNNLFIVGKSGHFRKKKIGGGVLTRRITDCSKKNLLCKLYTVETNYQPEVQGYPGLSSAKVPKSAKNKRWTLLTLEINAMTRSPNISHHLFDSANLVYSYWCNQDLSCISNSMFITHKNLDGQNTWLKHGRMEHSTKQTK
jgi:hypothetical protein